MSYTAPNQPGAPYATAKSEVGGASHTRSTPRGKHHFGYKSNAFNIVDDYLAIFRPLADPFVAANSNGHQQPIPGLEGLRRRFPRLPIGEVLGDAGKGMDDSLAYGHTDLEALRAIELCHATATMTSDPSAARLRCPGHPSVSLRPPARLQWKMTTNAIRANCGVSAHVRAEEGQEMCLGLRMVVLPATSPGRLRAAQPVPWQELLGQAIERDRDLGDGGWSPF